MKRKRWLSTFRKIILLFLIAVLISNLYVLVMRVGFKKDFPKVLGFAQTIVLSGSMEPSVKVGDMLILREQKTYEENDIVTFKGTYSFITHRIIEIDDKNAITKGDSNNAPDQPILLSSIEGKVILRIPRLGNLVLFLKTPFGILITSLLAIFIIEIPYFLDKKRSNSNS
ncbi:MAG: signal peptidase I [Peptostreptococcales bacterium]